MYNQMNIFQTKERKSTVDSRHYVGNSTYEELTEVLLKVTDKCSICTGPKMHICLEANCINTAFICIRCDEHQHRFHRLNELQMAMVKSTIAPDRQSRTHQLLDMSITELSRILRKVTSIVEESLKIIPAVQMSLNQFKELKANLIAKSSDGFEQLHRATQSAMALFRKMDNRELFHEEDVHTIRKSWKECRQHFSSSAKAINLNVAPERLADSLFIKVGKEFQSVEKLIMSFTSDEITKVPLRNPPIQSTWLQRMLTLKKDIYDADRANLLNETHLDRYVQSKWGTITISPTYRRSIAVKETMYHDTTDKFATIPKPCRRLKSIGDFGGPYANQVQHLDEPIGYISEISPNLVSLKCHSSLIKLTSLPQSNLLKLDLRLSGDGKQVVRFISLFKNLRVLIIETEIQTISTLGNQIRELVRFAAVRNLRSFTIKFVQQTSKSFVPHKIPITEDNFGQLSLFFNHLQTIKRTSCKAFMQAVAVSRTIRGTPRFKEQILNWACDL